MGRPREFDEMQALEQAMGVFWARGYDATSLCDLLGAMDLSKSSFYDTYGSKHELFLSTLDHYNRTVASKHAAAAIDAAPSAKAGIAAVFQGAVDCAAGGGAQRGCYLNNCAVEIAPHDPGAAKRVCNGLGQIEATFHCALRRAQEEGDLPADRDTRALARYLTSSLNGLMVMAKANPERAALEDVVRIVLQTLD